MTNYPITESLIPGVLASYAALRRVVVAVATEAMPPDLLFTATAQHAERMQRYESHVITHKRAEPSQRQR